jgi:isoquinoline 1-oxidoreductase
MAQTPPAAVTNGVEKTGLARFEVSRRAFLGGLCGGLVVLLTGGRVNARQAEQRPRRLAERVDAWLHLGEDGRVTVFTGKVEIGQGARTALSQIVADALDAPIEAIEMIMGDTALTPLDRGTLGSKTIRDMGTRLRTAAATARQALIELAAAQWQIPAVQLTTHSGTVVDPDGGREATYGALSRGTDITRVIDDHAAREVPAARRVSGRAIPRIEARDKVTGTARYTADLRPSGLLYGKVLRPPARDARLAAADVAAAEVLPGVVRMVRDGEFLGVVADHPEAAERALRAVRARWIEPPRRPARPLAEVLEAPPGLDLGCGALRRLSGCEMVAERGDVGAGLDASTRRLARRYETAYIAHAALEPHAAVAEWRGDGLTVWTCTQRPFGVRNDLARHFGLARDAVRVIVPEMGAAYGGKHKGAAAFEAARLARSVARPVQVAWNRAEEFDCGYFRPAALIDVEAGIGTDGRLHAWMFRNFNSGKRGAQPPYRIPHARVSFHPRRSPLPQGSYRSLANCANSFARESLMDEIAVELAADPIDFRLAHIDDERLRAVVLAAREKGRWRRDGQAPESRRGDEPSKLRRGWGFACGIDVGSYVAELAEVEVDLDSGAIRVVRVTAAFDCGRVINPSGLRQQIEGAIIQGMGGALWEEILFDSGRILNGAFSTYRVPRLSDLPEIDVVVLDRPEHPSTGAGEPPLIAIAPAIANAVFDATGVRLRRLPMTAAKLRTGSAGSGAG